VYYVIKSSFERVKEQNGARPLQNNKLEISRKINTTREINR